MKLFILVAGQTFDIPSKTTGNWIASYQTLEELHVDIEEIVEKGLIGEYTYYKIKGHKYDWYEVIDLLTWVCGSANG